MVAGVTCKLHSWLDEVGLWLTLWVLGGIFGVIEINPVLVRADGVRHALLERASTGRGHAGLLFRGRSSGAF